MAENQKGEMLHLHVSVGDVAIEVDGPVEEAETWFEALREDYLGDVDDQILTSAARSSANPNAGSGDHNQEAPSTQNVSSEGKSKSLPEYYRMADNPTKKDAALIVGWYLEYHKDQSDFVKPEIEEEAQDAKISLGANVSRDLSKQVEKSHLEKVNEREGQDAYHLTLTGEEYVEEELLELD